MAHPMQHYGKRRDDPRPEPWVPHEPGESMVGPIVHLKVNDLMSQYRPGSKDWDWTDEFAEIDERLFGKPILLGTDGRVLDGHHRIRLAYALGLEEFLPTQVIEVSE